MQTASLAIAAAVVEATASEQIKIEQEPWSVYTGKITKQELVRTVAARLAGTDYQTKIDCGLAGDQLISTLYLYPSTPGLPYRLYTDWGELSAPVIEEIEVEDEQVQFDGTTSASTRYPAMGILRFSWQDDCCNAEGEIITAPRLTAVDGELNSAAAVHATALISYRAERHTVLLNAPRREEALDQQWSSVVVAAYDGGLSVHELTMPPGIETFAADPDAICGASWAGTVGEEVSDPYPPEPQGADLITEVNYCDQATVREYTQPA